MMNKLKKAAAKVASDAKAENDKKLPDIDKPQNPFNRVFNILLNQFNYYIYL